MKKAEKQLITASQLLIYVTEKEGFEPSHRFRDLHP